MANAEAPGALRIRIAWSAVAGEAHEERLEVPVGTTLGEALERSGLLQRHPHLAGLPTGLWGALKPPQTVLREDDRVELYRPLQVDPKEARRQRYREQKESGKGVRPERPRKAR